MGPRPVGADSLVAVNNKIMNFKKNNIFFEKTRKIIPLASQTFSKSYLQYTLGHAPLFIEKGKGAYVWDIDGNKYLDMVNSLLAVVLGYQYPAVDRAIKNQLKKGITFSLASPLEYELSKELIKIIPCAEMVRFGKNGSDVTAGAVRLARAITKRERIAVWGYHGWQDWYIGVNPRNEGVPLGVKRLVHKFEYNNIASLEKLFLKYKNQFAAVIMEPMNIEEPKADFLKKVKDLAHKNQALFILDEIITGFRFSLGGAQKYFNVIPDLATFGKSMANGMPISVLVGKKEYMKKLEDVFFSFTFGGESLSLVASLATIKEIKEKNVISHLWNEGKYLKDKTNELIKENELEDVLEIQGKPCWHVFKINDYKKYSSLEIQSYIQQELVERGILWIGSHNMSFSHKRKDTNKLIKAYQEIFPLLKEFLVKETLKEKLLGKPILGNYKIR